MLYLQLLPSAICTLLDYPCTHCKAQVQSRGCLPAEKFLDLDFQHHDLGPVTGFNTPNSTHKSAQ